MKIYPRKDLKVQPCNTVQSAALAGGNSSLLGLEVPEIHSFLDFQRPHCPHPTPSLEVRKAPFTLLSNLIARERIKRQHLEFLNKLSCPRVARCSVICSPEKQKQHANTLHASC